MSFSTYVRQGIIENLPVPNGFAMFQNMIHIQSELLLSNWLFYRRRNVGEKRRADLSGQRFSNRQHMLSRCLADNNVRTRND